MKFLYLVALVALAACGEPDDILLSSALSSPRGMLNLFSSFEAQHSRHYTRREEKSRLKIFRRSVQDVARQNGQGLSWVSGINDFSDKTEEEKRMYYGLNMTGAEVSAGVKGVQSKVGAKVPESKSWIEAGSVTKVKSQGACGSCWAFAALGGLEGRYHAMTGVLRHLSEEQVLDCATRNDLGCEGFRTREGIKWIQRNNAVSSTQDYPYEGRDGECGGKGNRNAILGAKILKYNEISAAMGSDSKTIAALSQGVLSITMRVVNTFNAYRSGIYSDPTQANFPNHALVAVAYTKQYILVKNSWGSRWGDKGFIKVARHWTGCAMHKWVGYPILFSSGIKDTFKSDPKSEWIDDNNGGDNEGVDPTIPRNLALKSTKTSQSSDAFHDTPSRRAVDGLTVGKDYAFMKACTQTKTTPSPAWWKVVLDQAYHISSINVYNRQDAKRSWLNGAQVLVDGVVYGSIKLNTKQKYMFKIGVTGTEVKIQLPHKGVALSLAEVEVMGEGCPSGTTLCPDNVCRHQHMC